MTRQYRSKAALKLIELQQRTKVLDIPKVKEVRVGNRTKTILPGFVDLCAAPGGFSEVAHAKFTRKNDQPCTRGLAIDFQQIPPFPFNGVDTLRADTIESQTFILNKIRQTFRIPEGKTKEAEGGVNHVSVFPYAFFHDGVFLDRSAMKKRGIDDKEGVLERDISVLFRQNVMVMAALRIALTTFCDLQSMSERVTSAPLSLPTPKPQTSAQQTSMMNRMGVKEQTQFADFNELYNPTTHFEASNCLFLSKIMVTPHWHETVQPILKKSFHNVSELMKLDSSPEGSYERFVVASGFKPDIFRVDDKGSYRVPKGLLALHPAVKDLRSKRVPSANKEMVENDAFYNCFGCKRLVQRGCSSCC